MFFLTNVLPVLACCLFVPTNHIYLNQAPRTRQEPSPVASAASQQGRAREEVAEGGAERRERAARSGGREGSFYVCVSEKYRIQIKLNRFRLRWFQVELMDRTREFVDFLSNLGYREKNHNYSVSSFNIIVTQYLTKINIQKKLLFSTSYDYVNYDEYLRSSNNLKFVYNKNESIINHTGLTLKERNNFDNEMQSFIMSTVSALNDLKSTNQINSEHNLIILQDLQRRISHLGKEFQKLQRLRKQYDINPIQLFSKKISHNNSMNNYSVSDNSTALEFMNKTSQSSSSFDRSERNVGAANTDTNVTTQDNKNKNNNNQKLLPSNFSERYVTDVASSTKIEEYNHIVETQRQQLFAEAVSLREKFSEEAQQAERVGEHVAAISSALGDFLEILAVQTDDIEDINTAAEGTHDHVKVAETELITTVERSKSSNLSMAVFLFGMALLLLLIDFFTP